MAIQRFKIGARNKRMCDENPVANIHPTVKPVELMRWLVRLVTPPGGLVLDPFPGSGSTGEYVRIARARIKHWARLARQEARRAGA